MNKIIITILSSFLLSACQQIESRTNNILCKKDSAQINVKELTLNTKLACTNTEKSTGLMYRKTLPKNQAMLFVYDTDQILSFWMRNTFIPLSIAYIDANGKIIDIFDIDPLDETPISSTQKVRYALEVNQGLFKQYNININDVIRISQE